MTVATDAAPYAPRPGTVAFRALALLERRGELSASQIAEELGVLASGGIAPHLEAPLRHGLVERRRRAPHSRAPYWYRLVPAAAAPEASRPEPPSERAPSAPSVPTADDAPPPAVAIRLAPVEKPEVDSDSQSVRMVEDFRAIARSSRLVAEKAVQHRKDQLREDECRRGLKAVQVAVESANRDLGGTFIVGAGRQVFADAIKGLKTMESLRNAVDTAVAREKIVINQAAERVCGNLATIDKAGLPALFADRATLVHKDPEAVAAIVSQRVAEHRAAEDRRLEADRERIRAEERARAEADAAITRAATATPAAAHAAPVAAEQAQAVVEAPEGPTDAPTLKLGQINDRLGFTVTEAFLASIGVPCAGHDKRAVLFRESQWQVIKAKLIERIRGLA